MTEIQAVLSRVEMTAEIVSAYVEHNSVPVSELPALIKAVHESLDVLSGTRQAEVVAEPQLPAVPIKKSLSHDHIVCLEEGRRFKSLKRHLQAEHGLTPDAYRAKWGLGKDYPMVAPAYADARSTLAKTIGLGRKAASPVEHVSEAAPTPTEQAEAEAPKPGRRKAKAA